MLRADIMGLLRSFAQINADTYGPFDVHPSFVRHCTRMELLSKSARYCALRASSVTARVLRAAASHFVSRLASGSRPPGKTNLLSSQLACVFGDETEWVQD